MTRTTEGSGQPQAPPSDSSKVKEHIRKVLAKVRQKGSQATKRSALTGRISVQLASYGKLPLIMACGD